MHLVDDLAERVIVAGASPHSGGSMKRILLIGVGAAIVALIAGIAVLRWVGEGSTNPQAVATAPATAIPPDAAGPAAPGFDIVRVDPQGKAVIAGRAAPEAEVTILDGDHELGRVKADGRGEWVFLPEKPLPPGNHALSLVERLPNEEADRKSDGVVALLVPEPAPAATAAANAEANSSGAVAVLLPHQDNGQARALQTPPASPSAGIRLDIIQYGEADTLSMSGTAAPNAHLEIYLDDRRVGRATADARGQWSAVLAPTPPGRYQLRIESLGENGQVVARLALPFERAANLADAAFIVIHPGNSLWRIAERSYGSGFRYVEIYRANRGKIADPNLIYSGQVFALPQSR